MLPTLLLSQLEMGIGKGQCDSALRMMSNVAFNLCLRKFSFKTKMLMFLLGLEEILKLNLAVRHVSPLDFYAF